MSIIRIVPLFAALLLVPAGAQPVRYQSSDTERAFAILARADQEGLDPSAYALPRNTAPDSPEARAVLDRYMRDVSAGRPGLKAIDLDVSLPAPRADPSALDAAIARGNLSALLFGMAPPHPDYVRLKAALARYRAIAEQGGWPLLPDAAPAAFTGLHAPLLRRRLAVEDESVTAETNLADAVKRFQARSGLVEDGVVGARTRAALNITAAARVDTILANMERWRWLPRNLEPDRIWINVPDAQLQLLLGGRVVLASRVVVGRVRNPTPILRAQGAGVTINPPWNVPSSIAVKEILPKLRKNPNYLASQDMVLVNGPPGDPQGLRIDWHAVSASRFPYLIRQNPGPHNALGRIKIELPNRFDVYLHDTPVKSAFDQPARALSHGCIRVQEILPLATYVLGDAAASERIAEALDKGDTKYLAAAKTLPVYFLYWTAFGGDDGSLNFRPDIYGRDARLIAALKEKRMQVASAAGCKRG